MPVPCCAAVLYVAKQQLEKFKFVLDYKIKELKRQIEPRENEISDMRNQIEEMDLELEQVTRHGHLQVRATERSLSAGCVATP